MSLDREIGTFTPSQAREVWETTKLLRSSGLLRNLSTLARPDDPGLHQVFVKNTETEHAVPPFGCMQITGTAEVGEYTYITVKRPTETDGFYLFNHDTEIEAEGFGMALPWGIVRMLGGSAEPNKQYEPVIDSWEIAQQDGGPFTVYGPDNTREGVVKGRIGSAGSRAQIIQFSLVSDEYGADEPVPEKCSGRISIENYRGEVVRVPCGGSRPVFGEDYEGFVDLRDELGFLDGRDFRALVGKLGFATLLKPDNDYEDCYWCIVSIDFHREIQVVTDIVFGENTITIERANVKVWDDCKLDDEIIEGADCSDQYYNDGGGV
jgi:hypothetical protein